MQDDRPISVLILYAHPLLGEGLARLLSSEPGLKVDAAQSDDAERVERGLAAAPEVIIFERGDPDRAVQILERAPDALIIDVGIGPGPTFTYRREEISARPDAILEVIRQASSLRRRGGHRSRSHRRASSSGPETARRPPSHDPPPQAHRGG